MDLLLILFLVTLAFSCRLSEGRSDYLSLSNTQALRGIMAIAIILHHMSERTTGGVLFPFMQHMGYLIVSVFFFLSGFGLMISYRKKGQSYFRGFWIKRVLYLFAVFLLVSVVYAAYHLLIGDFRLSLTIAANSWYMIVQIILYIIFWMSFKIFEKRDKAAIAMIFLLQTVLMIVLIAMDMPAIWYISNYAFSVGVIWAQNEESIDGFIEKHYPICVSMVIIAFAAFSAIPLVVPASYLPSRLVSCVFFSAMVMLLIFKIRITGEIWSWLGKISLEVYLLHGLVYMVLRWVIKNEILWTAATVIITIPIAYVAWIINNRIKTTLRTLG